MLDPDAQARQTLRRYRGVATSLLALMAALTLATHYRPRALWHGIRLAY